MRDLRQAVHGRAIIMEKRVYKHQILKKLILKKKQHDLDVRSTLPANCLERCLRFENMPSVTENSVFVWGRERERERLVSRRGEGQVS